MFRIFQKQPTQPPAPAPVIISAPVKGSVTKTTAVAARMPPRPLPPLPGTSSRCLPAAPVATGSRPLPPDPVLKGRVTTESGSIDSIPDAVIERGLKAQEARR